MAYGSKLSGNVKQKHVYRPYVIFYHEKANIRIYGKNKTKQFGKTRTVSHQHGYHVFC